MAKAPDIPVKKSAFERFIRGIEVVGNKLPHPFWLFVILSAIVIGLSYYLSQKGVSVKYLAASSKAGEAPKEVTVAVLNLMSFKSMRTFLADFVKTYVGFAPLGLIMTMTLGIGLVEQTGFISALMRRTILGASSSSPDRMSPTIASRMSLRVTIPSIVPYSSTTSAISRPVSLKSSSTFNACIDSGT